MRPQHYVAGSTRHPRDERSLGDVLKTHLFSNHLEPKCRLVERLQSVQSYVCNRTWWMPPDEVAVNGL